MSDEQITIPKETAQRLFDALIGSMDYGSGFLETDDIKALRELAVSIGVDPLTCTPSEFITQYAHPFKADLNACAAGMSSRPCGKAADDPIHQAAEMGA